MDKMNIKEAIKQLKEISKEKFDSTVELHFNVNLDVKKADQIIRFPLLLPAGTGKDVKVAVYASKSIKTADIQLDEDSINEIISGELKPKTDFDVVIAEPKMMGKLAKAARVLGPAGVMPSPKNGTVTDNIEDAIESFKKGQIEIRTEQKHPIIHTLIGKISFKNEELIKNFEEVLTSLRQNKPQKAKPTWLKNCYICTTMSPSIEVEINS
jgi:large subunit ribosomal protein L1